MRRGPLKTGRTIAAGVITGRLDERAIRKAASAGADLIELRIDTFRQRDPGRLRQRLLKLREAGGPLKDLPLLITVRHASEGGEARIPDAERAAIYEALLPCSELVDIELRSMKRLKATAKAARRAGVGVVVSYHNFRATPSRAKLIDIIKKARAAGADVVKVAAHVEGTGELKRLAGLLVENDGLVVIAMGEAGVSSRVFFPALGSLITYGSVTASTAPGQLPLKFIKKELARYGL